MTEDRAKARAKTLRGALGEIGHEIAHGQALDLIARLEGLKDWNALAAQLATPPVPALPKGWSRAGDTPHHYDMGSGQFRGRKAAFVRLKHYVKNPMGFGTLMQTIEAPRYADKTVALDAELASEEVEGGVTLWMRADGAGRRSLAFDNLEYLPDPDGPLSGDRDWVPRRIVLHIPAEAETLSFGFYLRGSGTGWCSGMELSETDEAITGSVPQRASEPVNMSFGN
jgi:hypothetical protein